MEQISPNFCKHLAAFTIKTQIRVNSKLSKGNQTCRLSTHSFIAHIIYLLKCFLCTLTLKCKFFFYFPLRENLFDLLIDQALKNSNLFVGWICFIWGGGSSPSHHTGKPWLSNLYFLAGHHLFFNLILLNLFKLHF